MQKGNELKPHIGIFGRRNQGKSSLLNTITQQTTAIVSEQAGTTTDPIKKTMELTGIGPVVWIDTAGIDDIGDLGALRIEKTWLSAKMVDLALIVFSENNWASHEEELFSFFKKNNIPAIPVHNKNDLVKLEGLLKHRVEDFTQTKVVEFEKGNKDARDILLKTIRETLPESSYAKKSLLGDVLKPQSTVLLITPIDSSAPEGRLILPQVQVIRDILDNHGIAIVCKETEAEKYLQQHKVDLVVTDSQVFDFANKIVSEEIPLTSFSIVLARNKGLFEEYLEGTPKIDQLKEGDSILILESCTHQVSCEDIGRVKLPNIFRKYTRKKLSFEVVAGLEKSSKPMEEYAMVVQCGGCVVTHKQLVNKLFPAVDKNIPVTNYGMAIAYMNGIFLRGIEIFQNKE